MTLLRLLMLAAFALFLRADDLTDDLLAAARKGDAPAVKSLLDRGADVNAKSPYGSTPLFFACDRGNIDVVKLLIERGADVNVEDTFYHATALTWAGQHKHAEIVRLLLDHGAKSPAVILTLGVQTGNAEFVKIALAKGGIDKSTLASALTMAASKPEIAELLKAAGAEPVKTVQLDAAILAAYAGTYTGNASGTEIEMAITVKDGNLIGNVAGQRSVTFAASDNTHFHSVEVPGIDLEFGPDAVHLKQGGFNVDFKRKGQPK